MKNYSLSLMLALLTIITACSKHEDLLPDDDTVDYREDPAEWVQEETWMHLEGWTEFKPSTDTRIMYISEDGNDESGKYYSATDAEIGTDPFKPSGDIKTFATFEAAAKNSREGYPDWILFKRGEKFSDQVNPLSGRGENEYYLVASYGTSDVLPIVTPIENEGAAAVYQNVNRNPAQLNFTAIAHIDFYAETRDPSSPNYKGSKGGNGLSIKVSGEGSAQRILVEGCKFRFFAGNGVGSLDHNDVSEIIIRRCVISDTYSPDVNTAHCSGYYCGNINSIMLQENIFDHNGWLNQAPTTPAPATVFNHNTYFTDCKKVYFTENIFMRASSINNKFATYTEGTHTVDAAITNNIYIDGEIGIVFGAETDRFGLGSFANISIKGNVITEMGRSQPTNRTLGYGITLGSIHNGEVVNNFVISNNNPNVTNCWSYQLHGDLVNFKMTGNVAYDISGPSLALDASYGNNKDVIIKNNVFNDKRNKIGVVRLESLDGVSISENTYFCGGDKPFHYVDKYIGLDEWATATGDNSTFTDYQFPDPTRSIETYNVSVGGAADIDAFIEACKAQSMLTWNENYTAVKVGAWFKEGFAP